MTEDEILAAANAIKARRDRAKEGRAFMMAKGVQLVAFDNYEDIKRLDVPQDPELAAFLCRLLDCEISEGGEED